ncbi:MAG: hypothetical protein ACFFCW_01800 [Candidatus Hodarchaeota archaeon]
MKHDGIKGIIESGQAPGLMGLKKGPNMRYGNRGHRVDPERPDVYNDCAIQYKAIEEAGGMRGNPELQYWAKEHMKALRDKQDAGIIGPTDLDKHGGHPLIADVPTYNRGISKDEAIREAQQIMEAAKNGER